MPGPSAVGPRHAKGSSIYGQRTQQLSAIQSIQQLKILAAFGATDPPKAQDQGHRSPRAVRDGSRAPACARKCHLPDLERGELRMWGPRLITSHKTERFRSITCARTVSFHNSNRTILN